MAEDFSTWDLLLRNSAGTVDGVPLVIRASQYIVEIMENGGLIEPNEFALENFLSITIPEVVLQVIDIRDVSNWERDMLIGFLSLVTTLCLWALQKPEYHRMTALFALPGKIFRITNWLYMSGNWEHELDPETAVIRGMIATGELGELIRIVSRNDDVPFIGSLQMLLSVAQSSTITHNRELHAETRTCLTEGMRKFLSWLCSEEVAARFGAMNEIKALLQGYISFVNLVNRDASECIAILDFLRFCFRSSKLGLQLFGVSLIDDFVRYIDLMRSVSVRRWFTDTGFIEYLLTKGFNTEVLQGLVPVFNSFARERLLEVGVVPQLWDRTLSVHSSQKNAMYELLLSVLESFGTCDCEFLDQMMTRDEPTASEIAFLGMSVNRLFSVQMQICDALWGWGATIKGALQALSQAVKGNASVDLKKHLIELCFEDIKNPEHMRTTVLLPDIAHNVNRFGGDTAFLNMCLDALVYDREVIMHVIGITMSSLKAVSADNLSKLGAQIDDHFWTLMFKIFDGWGVDAMSSNAFEVLDSMIDDYCFEYATIPCITFLWAYVVIINCKSGYVRGFEGESLEFSPRVPARVKFVHYPLRGVDYIFRVLKNAESPAVADKSIPLIVNFYSDTLEREYTWRFITEMFLNVIDDKGETTTVRTRYMNALYQFITRAESGIESGDDYVLRHGIVSDMSVPLVRISSSAGEKVFCAGSRTGVDKVYSRFNSLLKSGSNRVYLFMDCNRSDMAHGMEVGSLPWMNESKCAELQAYESYTGIRFRENSAETQQLPSVYLSSCGFVDRMYVYLRVPKLEEAAKRLLDFLPDNPEVTKLITSDLSMLFEHMKRASSSQITYCFECLMNQIRIQDREARRRTVKIGDIETLIEIFLDDMDSADTEKLLFILDMLVTSASDLANRGVCETLAKQTLVFAEQGNIQMQEVALSFLAKLITFFPEMDVLCDNVETVKRVIIGAKRVTWPLIKKCLVSSTNCGKVFSCLVPYLDGLTEGRKCSNYIIEAFIALLPVVSSGTDMSDVYIRVMQLVKIESGKRFVILVGVFLKLMEKYGVTQEDASGLTDALITRAFQSANTAERAAMFNVCSIVAKKYDEVWQKLLRVLHDYVCVAPDCWSYNASEQVKTDVPFSGLSNLGATCYMNSILQQLNQISAFRNQIFGTVFEGESQKQLQMIFVRLAISCRRTVLTRPFCDVWRGWDRQLINVHEQQDANEFLGILLDQLPEGCHCHFKGTIVRIMDGIDTVHHSEVTEPFFSIPLDVQGFDTIEESIASSCQAEQFSGEDRLQTDAGKIDVMTYRKVRTLPQVLVFQLKRFDFATRGGEVKVTDRFEFQDLLNVSPLLENSEEVGDLYYRLKGVVLHAGMVNGGHYVSLVRDGDVWYRFNDTEVTVFDSAEFANETYGGQEKRFSAFMLFYEVHADHDVEVTISDDLRANVMKENSEVQSMTALFSLETLKMISESRDWEIILEYVLNVWSRSTLNSASIMESLRKAVVVNSNQGNFFRYLEKHSDKLIDIYVDCNVHDNVEALNNCVLSLVDWHNVSASVTILVETMLRSLPMLEKRWQQFPYLLKIPTDVIDRGCFDVSDDKKSEMAHLLSGVIVNFYTDGGHAAHGIYCFREMFLLLANLWPSSEPSPLANMRSQILCNCKHAIAYFVFLISVDQETDIDGAFAYYTVHDKEIPIVDFGLLLYTIARKTDYDISQRIIACTDMHKEDCLVYVSSRYQRELELGNDVLRLKLVKSFATLLFPFILLAFQQNSYFVARRLPLLTPILSRLVPDASAPPCELINECSIYSTCLYDWADTENWSNDDHKASVFAAQRILDDITSSISDLRAIKTDMLINSHTPPYNFFFIIALIRWMSRLTNYHSHKCYQFLLLWQQDCVKIENSAGCTCGREIARTLLCFPDDLTVSDGLTIARCLMRQTNFDELCGILCERFLNGQRPKTRRVIFEDEEICNLLCSKISVHGKNLEVLQYVPNLWKRHTTLLSHPVHDVKLCAIVVNASVSSLPLEYLLSCLRYIFSYYAMRCDSVTWSKFADSLALIVARFHDSEELANTDFDKQEIQAAYRATYVSRYDCCLHRLLEALWNVCESVVDACFSYIIGEYRTRSCNAFISLSSRHMLSFMNSQDRLDCFVETMRKVNGLVAESVFGSMKDILDQDARVFPVVWRYLQRELSYGTMRDIVFGLFKSAIMKAPPDTLASFMESFDRNPYKVSTLSVIRSNDQSFYSQFFGRFNASPS